MDSSPVIAGDFVLAGSGDGRLVLLSLSRGTESWSFDLGDPLRGSPAVTKGLVVVSSEGGMLRAFEE